MTPIEDRPTLVDSPRTKLTFHSPFMKRKELLVYKNIGQSQTKQKLLKPKNLNVDVQCKQ